MWTTIRASTLIKPIGEFKDFDITYNYTRRSLQEITFHNVFNRFNRQVQLLPTQRDIIRSVATPLEITRVTANIVPNEWNRSPRPLVADRYEGVCEFTDRFPRARILCLPTGSGKTLVSIIGGLNFMANAENRVKMTEDFHNFLECRRGITPRGTINQIEASSKRVLLNNVMIIYSPRQLISQWRDTVCANLASIPGVACEVMTAEKLRTTSYDIAKIQENPNKIFVYIVHHNTYGRFLVERPKRMKRQSGNGGAGAGAAIVIDDSDDSENDSDSDAEKITEYTVGMLLVDELS